MRKDISKVVVERERAGSKTRFGDHRHALYNVMDRDGMEHAPTKLGHKRAVGYAGGDYKSLTDHLAPLYGFIRKNVGRPWNLVYSEICENLKGNSTAVQHVRSHINDFVELHVDIVDGVPIRKQHSFYLGLGRTEFYVNPTTGLLCKVNEKRAKKALEAYWKARGYRLDTPPKNEVKISASEAFRKIKGIWYKVTFKEIGARDGKGTEWVLDTKHTLNKKELKQYELENEYIEE